MDNIKNDKYYIEKVIDNINAIVKYTANLSYEDFMKDDVLIDATMFRLIQMVENLNHVSIDFREKHKEIKWGLIIGFRNGIVHDYGKVDYTIVYDIIIKDIYELKEALIDSFR